MSLDGDVERLKVEVAEQHKSKRQLLDLVEQKNIEISEKNALIKSYLDKIVCISSSSCCSFFYFIFMLLSFFYQFKAFVLQIGDLVAYVSVFNQYIWRS